jgi:CRP/FNR family cyclic AMP-dependent transcriptional regulator
MVQQNGTTHESRSFPPHAFFSTIGDGRQLVSFKKNATIFTQGDATEAVFFIQSGRVKLSVVSGGGREAILGVSSATAMTDCILLRIEKKAMALAIRQDATLANFFVYYLLERNVRHQEDLVDQLFNSSEKRLARVLLLLADSGKQAVSGSVVPKLPQETLAEMVGTTRSRVSFFLNRFRKLGLIHYKTRSDLLVDSSRLQVVLRDDIAVGSIAGHNSTIGVKSNIFQNSASANNHMIRVGRLDKLSPTRRKKEQQHPANQSEPPRALGSAA